MRRLGKLFVLALLLWGLPGVLHAQALKRASQAVQGRTDEERPRKEERRRESRDEPRRERHVHRAPPARGDARSYPDAYRPNQRWGDADDDGDSAADAAFMAFAKWVVLGPWTLPAAVVAENNPKGYGIPIYPYADDLAYSVSDDPAADQHLKPYLLRLQAGATARNPNLVSGTLAAQLDFAVPVALRLDYRLVTEAVSGERSYAGLGNLELLYRFAESRAVRFHTGIGYVQWADPAGLGHGVGFIYGFEAFPFQPVSFGSRVSIGPLGKTYALQWRSHIGVLISRYELQVAYDHLDVGGAQLGGLQLSVAAHL